MNPTDTRIPESDHRAFRAWLRFSRADEMLAANLREGRQGVDPVQRWTKSVTKRVKDQFRAETK